MKKIIIWTGIGFAFLASILLLIYYSMHTFSLNGNIEVTIPYGQEYEDAGYNAKKIDNNKIEIRNTVDTSVIGEYTVTYIYHGVFSKKLVRKVNVVDDKPPIITLTGDALICPLQEYVEEGYTALDEYDGDITDKVTKGVNGDTITYYVEDSSYNKTEVKRTVRKEDTHAPTITLKGFSTVYVKQGDNYIESGYNTSDNCGNVKVEEQSNVNTKTLGTYHITYLATDDSHNTASVTRTVVVYNNDTSSSKGVIYLTFDDGPVVGTTDKILDVLKKEDVKATFFVTGQFGNTDYLLKREYDEGHTIGLHTYSHKYSQIYASINNYFNDLLAIQNRVKDITGYTSYIIRFPGGSSNTVSKKYSVGIMTKLSQLVTEKGYHYFDWNVVSSDTSCSTSDCVYNNVIKEISKDKANYILMHDIKKTTADSLERIIAYGKANGYRFEKITMDTKEAHHSINN